MKPEAALGNDPSRAKKNVFNLHPNCPICDMELQATRASLISEP